MAVRSSTNRPDHEHKARHRDLVSHARDIVQRKNHKEHEHNKRQGQDEISLSTTARNLLDTRNLVHDLQNQLAARHAQALTRRFADLLDGLTDVANLDSDTFAPLHTTLDDLADSLLCRIAATLVKHDHAHSHDVAFSLSSTFLSLHPSGRPVRLGLHIAVTAKGQLLDPILLEETWEDDHPSHHHGLNFASLRNVFASHTSLEADGVTCRVELNSVLYESSNPNAPLDIGTLRFRGGQRNWSLRG